MIVSTSEGEHDDPADESGICDLLSILAFVFLFVMTINRSFLHYMSCPD